MNFLILIVVANVALGFHINDQSHQGQPLNRSKRLVNKGNLWPNGIVPYQFDSSLSKVRRTEYLEKVFPVYEKFSCIRFIPWTMSTKAELGHNNYLIFESTNQCISKIGRSGNKGQRISCCFWRTCLHEVGHALGLHHEHISPIRNQFVRIENENIVDNSAVLQQFIMKDENSVNTFNLYDYDSFMHYGIKTFSSNGEPTITFLDPDTRQVSKFANKERYYYLFMEINAAYKCADHCNLNCANDGYKAIVNNKCACRCPEGLDGTSSCKSLKKKDYPCGGIIDLTYENREITIQSPHITGVNKDVTCYWFIKSPENTRIFLDFPTIDVHKRDGKCVDEIAVRPYRLGMYGVSYCGNILKKTIPSERNIIGFSFTQKADSSSKFTAKATFRKESEYCYNLTNGGEHYNGKVRFAADWSSCLPWHAVRQCRHHLFKYKDADKNLEKNYCRNPDNTRGPWCYTNAEGCVRNYCDACNYGECKNTVNNCKEKIDGNPSYCKTNDNASRDCRKACNLCDDPLPSISTTVCGAPVLPPDARQDSLKAEYSVGEKVVVVCNKRDTDVREMTCLSDGNWTPLKYVCGTCRDGWTNFGRVCYKLFEENKLHEPARRFCQDQCEGCSLLRPNKFNEGFIKEFLQKNGGCREVWTDLTFEYSSSDGEVPDWINWAEPKKPEGCVSINSKCLWRDEGCRQKNKFVCQYDRSVPTECSDQRDDCETLVNEYSTFCDDWKSSFAVTNCAKTCGYCK